MKNLVVICIIVVTSVNTLPPLGSDMHTTRFSEMNVKSRSVNLTEVYTRKGRAKLGRFQQKYLLEFQNDPLESSLQSFDYSREYNVLNLCKSGEARQVWRALLWLQMFLVYSQLLSAILLACSSTSTIVSTVNTAVSSTVLSISVGTAFSTSTAISTSNVSLRL